MNKTGRKRGLVRKVIRTLAASQKRFTVEDLCPPLDPIQAQNNCGAMVREGELRRIVPSYKLPYTMSRTVYGPANLRPACLTGEHL